MKVDGVYLVDWVDGGFLPFAWNKFRCFLATHPRLVILTRPVHSRCVYVECLPFDFTHKYFFYRRLLEGITCLTQFSASSLVGWTGSVRMTKLGCSCVCFLGKICSKAPLMWHLIYADLKFCHSDGTRPLYVRLTRVFAFQGEIGSKAPLMRTGSVRMTKLGYSGSNIQNPSTPKSTPSTPKNQPQNPPPQKENAKIRAKKTTSRPSELHPKLLAYSGRRHGRTHGFAGAGWVS